MVFMVPLLIMATSLVSKINRRVALVKGWVNSFLAFMGQLYIGFYKDAGIPRSTLSRLVKRTKLLGAIACVPYGSYSRKTAMHPAFQECIRRLYLLPTRLSMTAISEHTEMQHGAARLSKEAGKPVKLPSYAQVRKEVQRLSIDS